jgi:hypothetical protein
MTKSLERMKRTALLTAALAFCGVATSASAYQTGYPDYPCYKRGEAYCAYMWNADGWPDYPSCVEAYYQNFCYSSGEGSLVTPASSHPAATRPAAEPTGTTRP